jgi:hypothetical protein
VILLALLLYGAGSTVVIQVIEETDGRERVRRKWTAQGEVENLPQPC